MSIYLNNNEGRLTDSEACYEAVASQEETYLEETEEDLRAILIFDDPSPQNNNWMLVESSTELSLRWEGKSTMNEDDSAVAGELDEQLGRAAEELITGDSDDPPLNDEAVVEMINLAMPKD